MINLSDHLDSKKYKMVYEKSETKIFHLENGMVNQEKSITLTEQSKETTVFVHNRDQIHEIAGFENRTDALGLAIILCHKHFESLDHSQIDMEKIKTASNIGDFEKILEVISAGCKKEYFSILEFSDRAICMIRNHKLFDVYLNYGNMRKVIVKDVSLFRASIVTRNYAKLLERYEELFDKISNTLTSTSKLKQEFIIHFLF